MFFSDFRHRVVLSIHLINNVSDFLFFLGLYYAHENLHGGNKYLFVFSELFCRYKTRGTETFRGGIWASFFVKIVLEQIAPRKMFWKIEQFFSSEYLKGLSKRHIHVKDWTYSLFKEWRVSKLNYFCGIHLVQ